MNELMGRLDPARLLIAGKTCLALILAFAITLQLDWKPSFMAILIVVLQTDAIGATLEKAVGYIAGTLGGAAVALAAIGLFAQDRPSFIIAMALLTGYAVYRMQGSRNAYAWLIFIVTLALVGWLPAQTPDAAFDVAVMRASTICVGVVVMLLVQGIFWPATAGTKFEQLLRSFLEEARNSVVFMGKTMNGEKADPLTVKQSVTTQIRTIDALGGCLEAAAGDTPRFKQFHAGYLELIGRLKELLLALIAVQDGISNGIDQPARKTADFSVMAKAIEGQLDRLIDDLDKPRDQTGRETESLQGEGLLEKPAGSIENGRDGVILHRLDDLALRITQVARLMCCVESPGGGPVTARSPAKEPFSFKSTRFQKAVSGALVSVIMAWFFVVTQWPMGLSLAMVFGSLAIGFGALLPLILIRRQLLLSLLVAPALAAPLYFGVMHRLDGYLELVPWLCIIFLPLFYLQASPKPQTMVLSIFSSIFLIALLSLDEQNQSYSFSSFITMWFGFAGGFGISLAVFRLFTRVVPERELWKQTCKFFRDSEEFIGEVVQNPTESAAKEKIIHEYQKRWQGTLKQLRMWSSTIDYRRGPPNRGEDIKALIESIEYLAFRLWSVASDHRQSTRAGPPPVHEMLSSVYDSILDSLRTISRSLAGQQPVPKLSDDREMIQDFESRADHFRQSLPQEAVVTAMNGISNARFLAQAIENCRSKANAIDWQAWNRNYL